MLSHLRVLDGMCRRRQHANMPLANKAQIKVLEELLRQYEPEFQKAQQTVQQLSPIIDHLRSLIVSLGDGTTPLYEIANGVARRDSTTGVGMPRIDFYAGNPTIEAARQVFPKAGGGPMHLDDMIAQMFEVNKEDTAQFTRVKRTLALYTSSLISYLTQISGRFRGYRNARNADHCPSASR